MVLSPKLFDLFNQLLFRMLDMDLVYTLGAFYSSRTPLARLFPIALDTYLACGCLLQWRDEGQQPRDKNTSRCNNVLKFTDLCACLLTAEASITCH